MVLAECGTYSHVNSGCGFPAPSVENFIFPPMFKIGSFGVTKPMLLCAISVLVVVLFFWAAFMRPKLVPRGIQNVGELAVGFVRDQILRPEIGKKGDRFLPFLVTLFFFIWIMNLMEIIPFFQFPVTSRIAFPAALTAMVYITYMYLGIKHQGGLGFFRNIAVPEGAPGWLLPLLAPLELAQAIIVRPFTLAVRLFANMFAGHVMLATFSIAAWYLLVPSISALYATGSLILAIVLTAFELLIQALQAYIFTMLTASYIAGSLEAGH